MIMSAHEDYLHWMVHKPSESPLVAGLSMMNGINNFLWVMELCVKIGVAFRSRKFASIDAWESKCCRSYRSCSCRCSHG